MVRCLYSSGLRILSALVLIMIFCGDMWGQKKFVDDLPHRAEVISDFSMARLIGKLDELPLHHIEGIWQFPATGVEVAMLRREQAGLSASGRVYDMILVNSPNRVLRPGTVMGVVVATGRRGEYDAKIFTKTIGTSLTLPKKFTLKLSDGDSSLEIKPVKGRMIFNLWRLLPYLWRYAVYPSREPVRSDGCIRIYPNPPAPLEPVYF